MDKRVPLANLDVAIRDALKESDFPGNPLIYGFVAPDWYDREDALNLAGKVIDGLGRDDLKLEPAAMRLKGPQVAIGKIGRGKKYDKLLRELSIILLESHQNGLIFEDNKKPDFCANA